MEVRETLAYLLPKTIARQLDACALDEAQTHITLFGSSTQTEPRCPACDVPARHIHSRYLRTLTDLPWSGHRVMGRLRVRKLFCRHAICPQRIVPERLPGLAAPWARRTWRLAARRLAIGLALGGAAGGRLSRS